MPDWSYIKLKVRQVMNIWTVNWDDDQTGKTRLGLKVPWIICSLNKYIGNVKRHHVGTKTTGSLDVYHILPDSGMASLNVLPVKVTWQDKYWLTTRTQKNIYFLSHKAFSRLQALKTSNLFEEGSHSPLRFPLSEGLDFPTTTHPCTVKYVTQHRRRVQVHNQELWRQTRS